MGIQLSEMATKVIGILILAVWVGGLVFGIVRLIGLLLKLKKLNRPENIKYFFLIVFI